MTIVYLAFVEGGHGLETKGKESDVIKSLGRKVKEWEFNNPVARKIRDELEKNGVKVFDVAPGNSDVPLITRTNTANRIYKEFCDKYGKENVRAVYVSIHYNALDGKFDGPGKDPEGLSVHIQPGSKEGRKLAGFILEELKKGTLQKNRGIVEQNLHVTRTTNMPAVLTENGFMDNEREALLMINTQFQNEVAAEHAKGILNYFGMKFNHKEGDNMEKKEPIVLSKNQQKDLDLLVSRNYVARDYKVYSGEMVALITIIAAQTRDLLESGALK